MAEAFPSDDKPKSSEDDEETKPEENGETSTSADGDEENREKHFCNVHTTEELCRYCRDCQKTLCMKCLADEHQEPNHWVQTLEEVEPWARQRLRDHIGQMKAKTEELEVYKAQLQKRQEDLEKWKEEACAQVDRDVENIITMVKQARDEAVKRYYLKLLQDALNSREDDVKEPDLD
ncbi:hypothetical protein SNE40_020282 [Patella caerulea]|uniref:B box-type domain-containing protein n=1 Tax=Patella caerulea TaxID=87958 RepID=A0AAN8GAA6_PATCE